MRKYLLLSICFLLLFSCKKESSNTKSNVNRESHKEVKKSKQLDGGLNGESSIITIRAWYHTSSSVASKYIMKFINRFNSMQSEIQVELVNLPEVNYNEYLEEVATQGELPDILDIDGPNMSYYAWSGFIIPLDDYISDRLMDDLLPSIKKQGYYQGCFYAIGQFDSGLAIWGNSELLKRAGVRIPTSIEEPWDYEEFLNVLKRLKGLDGIEYPIDMKMSYGPQEWFTYGFSPILLSFGGDLIDRENFQRATGVLNSKKSIRGMKEFQRWFEKGYVLPADINPQAFDQGKAGLSWGGYWMYTDYSRALGDKLVLIPMPKLGDRAVTSMGSWAWAISSNCQHPEAAWRFLEFFIVDN